VKDPLVKGHPLHAIATHLPIGGLLIGVGCELVGLVWSAPALRSAADVSLGVALLGGVAAALIGLWDYQAVPREHPARRIGAWHGWTNAGALGLLGAGVGLRWVSGPGPAATLLALLAFAAMSVGGWLGGDLVYRLGWRVVPAEHAEQLEDDLRRSGETSRIERAHRTVRAYEDEHALIP
jgi:uncharacterized membrane protein